MSGQGAPQGKSKTSSARLLRFTPDKETDASLITSSARKKEPQEKEHRTAAKRAALPYRAEAASSIEHLRTPELKRRKVEVEQPNAKDHELAESQSTTRRSPAEEAQTANPPRPPPELPPGIPAPPIPQGRIAQPTEDYGHLQSGSKPKGVLQTIFSPMFHLFQPPGEGAPGESGKQDNANRPVRKSRSRSPEQVARNDISFKSGVEPQMAAKPDSMRPPEAEPPAKAPGVSSPASGSAVSEGASSTDRESETCVETLPAATSTPRVVPEDSEGDSEMGEEVYMDEAGNDLDEDSLEFDPYAFIKSLPPLEQCAPAWRRCLLPKQTRQCKRKTLVLDLDETLVHSTLDGSISTDFRFEVFFNNRTHSVNVRQRPHLATFLERCATLFEVVVFTASQRLYAEQLLNILDPQRKLIRHRIFRDDCVFVEGNYLKDLTVLGRDLAHTVIVDNSPQAFGFQLANGVPIESWYDDASDTELVRLLPFLESLVDVPDVRPIIVNAFKLHKLVAQAPLH